MFHLFFAQGLIPAVKQVFPESEHRFCVRHLYGNFQEKFKGETLKKQLWACARSSSEIQFNIMMGRMKELNLDAWKWLDKMEPNTWVRAYFSAASRRSSALTVVARDDGNE
jgi:hypothetical protein